MSLQKYLQTINTIDPGKIYIENVRSILNVSKSSAKVICEMAVKENLFIKQVGLICPYDQRIISHYNSVDEIPDEVTCHICESEEREKFTFKTSELQKIVFYQLNK